MKIVLLALAACALWAQELSLAVSSPAWNGLEVRFHTKVEPAGANANAPLPGTVFAEGGRVHHFVEDPANRRAFGYDLSLKSEPGQNSVELRIEPVRRTRATRNAIPAGWTLVELPKYPNIPKVQIGDTVALNLLVNAATGQKIVDYLTVTRPGAQPETAAHDFTLADMELFLMAPRLWVNGKLAAASTSISVSGPVVWMYLPGHGRFTLSLFPDEQRGFRKSGTAGAQEFVFHQGATEYRVECASRVAPGSGRYNLYVRHEPAWSPGAENTFRIGANGHN